MVPGGGNPCCNRVTVGVRYKRSNDVEEGKEIRSVYVIQISRVAIHSPLVTEYVVPVVAIFPTGTEGGDKVLWYVDSKSARDGEVLLA